MLKFIESTDFIAEAFFMKSQYIAEYIMKVGYQYCVEGEVPLFLMYLGAAFHWKNKDIFPKESEEYKFMTLQLDTKITSATSKSIVDALDKFDSSQYGLCGMDKVLNRMAGKFISASVDFDCINRVYGRYMVNECDTCKFLITQYLHAIAINEVKKITQQFLDDEGIIFTGNFYMTDEDTAKHFISKLYVDEITDSGKCAAWYTAMAADIRLLSGTLNEEEKRNARNEKRRASGLHSLFNLAKRAKKDEGD